MVHLSVLAVGRLDGSGKRPVVAAAAVGDFAAPSAVHFVGPHGEAVFGNVNSRHSGERGVSWQSFGLDVWCGWAGLWCVSEGPGRHTAHSTCI